MNKRILLTLFFVLTVVLSVGTIYASDVNNADSYTSVYDEPLTESIDDSSSVSVYDSNVDSDSQNDVSESEDSNTLSTNIDESNNLISDDGNIDVSQTITAKNVTKYYKGTAKYTATFYDSQGNPLANTNVQIRYNGQTYTHKTDANGAVSININLKPGTYTVLAVNPVTGYNLRTTYKILSTISATGVTKVVVDNKRFTAKFYTSAGKALANKNVKFRLNGKLYTVQTNANGVATLALNNLNVGTYQIVSYNLDGLNKTNNIRVVRVANTVLTADQYTFLKSDTKYVSVKLTDHYGNIPPAGQTVSFRINYKTYTAKTNSLGVASLKLPDLDNGAYLIIYSFAQTSNYKASTLKSKVTIIPNKNPTFTVKSTTTFGYGARTPFVLALKSGDMPLANKEVTLTINSAKFTRTTNSNGLVSLPINLNVGTYTISYTNKAESKINSVNGSTQITVKNRAPTTLEWKTETTLNQGIHDLKVLVLDSNNKPLAGKTIQFTINSKNYTATTDSKGYATYSANLQTVGEMTIGYSYAGDNDNAPQSNSVKLNILKVPKISINNILTGSINLKTYYSTYNKLPTTVTAGGISFTIPEFLYLMSQAIYQLGNNNNKDIDIIYGVNNAASPTGDTINSRQLQKADYITVAKNVANYIKNHKTLPNYATSAVGKIIVTEVVDAFSRVLAFYKNNDNYLPNYVVINTGSDGGGGSSQSGTGLNERNTVADISIYLKATTNCPINNNAIKNVVDSLTSGLTTDLAKATAIYNYVRDSITYSFYYDTKYGAAGTLNAKKGNCVDQAHLLISMLRTAKIPARYVHGTCTFSSGSTYGHVWAQVLINDYWYVVDGTSTRNSFGKIVNWNTKSFSLKGIYPGISF